MKTLKFLPLIVVLSLLDVLAPAGQDNEPAASSKSQPRDTPGAAHREVATKAVDVTASVVTPDQKPAAKAKIALVQVGRELEIRNGELVDRWARCPIETTDQAGRFHFATEARDFWLVVVHLSGVAQIKCARDSIPMTITLIPWARVEGTYRVARKPKPGVFIDISWQQNLMIGAQAAHLVTTGRQTTDSNGRFVFDRVIPGRGRIGSIWRRNLADPSETISACARNARFVSGKTTHVEFGASGRPVIGQLKRPSTAPEVPWSQAYVSVRADGALGEDNLDFTATAASTGEFQFDDVPIGKYSLFVWFTPRGVGRLLGHPFEVSDINEKLSQRPVDLGVLQLTEDPKPAVKVFKK